MRSIVDFAIYTSSFSFFCYLSSRVRFSSIVVVCLLFNLVHGVFSRQFCVYVIIVSPIIICMYGFRLLSCIFFCVVSSVTFRLCLLELRSSSVVGTWLIFKCFNLDVCVCVSLCFSISYFVSESVDAAHSLTYSLVCGWLLSAHIFKNTHTTLIINYMAFIIAKMMMIFFLPIGFERT